MFARMTVIALATFLLAADAPKEDAVQQEVQKLQGTWKVVKFEAGGMDQTANGPKEIVVKGDEFRGLAPNAKFTIDPSKEPKALDLVDKDDAKKVFPLIYELSGDELKIAFPLVAAGKGEQPKRPDGFQTKDKPVALITAKREKP